MNQYNNCDDCEFYERFYDKTLEQLGFEEQFVTGTIKYFVLDIPGECCMTIEIATTTKTYTTKKSRLNEGGVVNGVLPTDKEIHYAIELKMKGLKLW